MLGFIVVLTSFVCSSLWAQFAKLRYQLHVVHIREIGAHTTCCIYPSDRVYELNIQEDEQKYSLGQLASEKTQSQKNSPNIEIEATQGKHPVNDRKKLPLGHTNIENLAK